MRNLFLILALSFANAQNYVRHVFPIWQKHCVGCHASGTNMGSLDLETWEGLQRGGNHGTILVPGDAQASRLYTMLIGETKPAMPMDGQVLSEGEIDVVRRWIAAGAPPPTAAEIAALKLRAAGEESQILAMAWRPGSEEVAVARSQHIELLDPATAQLRISFGGPSVGALAFSPDGKVVASAGDDLPIRLWNASTGQELRTLKGAPGRIRALAFTPDGYRLMAGSDRAIQIFNPETGKLVQTLPWTSGEIGAMTFSTDGHRIATAGRDGLLRLWNLGPTAIAGIRSVPSLQDSVIALAWYPDGSRLISSGADQTVKVFDGRDLTELKSFPKRPNPAYGLAPSPDGARIVVGLSDGTVTVFEK